MNEALSENVLLQKTMYRQLRWLIHISSIVLSSPFLTKEKSMFYQVPILIAIFLAMTRPESGGDIALAFDAVFASMFYILMFEHECQKEVSLDLEADLNTFAKSCSLYCRYGGPL